MGRMHHMLAMPMPGLAKRENSPDTSHDTTMTPPAGRIRPTGCLDLACGATLETAKDWPAVPLPVEMELGRAAELRFNWQREFMRVTDSPPVLRFHWQKVSARAPAGTLDMSDIELALPTLAFKRLDSHLEERKEGEGGVRKEEREGGREGGKKEGPEKKNSVTIMMEERKGGRKGKREGERKEGRKEGRER
ncbi:hypothetical protein L345_02854, partial [Ophiophagus hannah]